MTKPFPALAASLFETLPAMRPEQFRDHMLALLLLRRLSTNYERTAKRELGHEYPDHISTNTSANKSLAQWYRDNPADIPRFEDQMLRKIRYVLLPHHLWPALVDMARRRDNQLAETLHSCFCHIEHRSSRMALSGLFSHVHPGSTELGPTRPHRTAALSAMVTCIQDAVATPCSATAQAAHALIRHSCRTPNINSGWSYTPPEIRDILAAIATSAAHHPRKHPLSVLDFACGSGSLLLAVRELAAPNPIRSLTGQEIHPRTCNLARMNMLLHGLKDTEFRIFRGDTLANGCETFCQPNPARRPQFDAIVSVPPFTQRWNGTPFADDIRFRDYGLAPNSTADAAFVLHGLHYLADDGIMAVVLHPGILFRQGPDAQIRRKLVERGCIDTVVALPGGLFPSTGIATCMVVCRKPRPQRDILFINASGQFTRERRRNRMGPQHVRSIMDTIRQRPASISNYAKCSSTDEVRANDWNLNPCRHVTTATGVNA